MSEEITKSNASPNATRREMRSGRRVHTRSIRRIIVKNAESDSGEVQSENIDVSESNACAATQKLVRQAVNSPKRFTDQAGESDARSIKRKRQSSIANVVSAMQTSQAFASAIRDPKPTVKCHILSLHGYSSLRMFEAKPRACMDKVRNRVS